MVHIPGAVIFAAGIGRRMGKLTRLKPKTLLPLDDYGTTFLDCSLRSLIISTAISRITIVGGYCVDVLKKHLTLHWGESMSKNAIELIVNPYYCNINNISSMVTSYREIIGGAIILNSDILFHPQILTKAEKQIEINPQNSFLIIDDSVVLGKEQMKVNVNKVGRVIRIGKDLKIHESHGEYIGICYLSCSDAPKVLKEANTLLARGEIDKYYEDAFDSALDKMHLGIISTEGLPWIEVDTPVDYCSAKEMFKIHDLSSEAWSK